MKNHFRHAISKAAILCVITSHWHTVHAQVAISTFQAGDKLSAATMNDNFAAMKAALEALQTQVATQQATITSLQSNLAVAQTALAAVQGNSVLALDGYLRFERDARGYATAHFAAVNVQVSNGTNVANDLSGPSAVNGLGNLIIGYNIEATSGTVACSLGATYFNQTSCEADGGIWSNNFKTGSHNLVIGEQHNFGRDGGLVAGFHNTVAGRSSVSFGFNNRASGNYINIVGGANNTASGIYSSISGGINNQAGGSYSSVLGGTSNITAAPYASVLGGSSNTAAGYYSTVSGGVNNIANGNGSSVSGGYFQGTNGDYDWRGGSLYFSDD